MLADPLPWRAIVVIFLPFAFGYYLSYVFRTINALISGGLISDLSLNAAELGLITSVYFLTFALAQLPLGVLLDRVGPRKVQSLFLLVAAAGAALFGSAHGFTALIVGRGLIGLGVAASLMAGLKSIVLWFPKERIPLVNGWFIMFGALGAVTATAPADWLLPSTGWRGLYDGLSVATAVSALLIYAVVPEHRAPRAHEAPISLMVIYKDRRFQRLAATVRLTDRHSLVHARALGRTLVHGCGTTRSSSDRSSSVCYGGGALHGCVVDRFVRRPASPARGKIRNAFSYCGSNFPFFTTHAGPRTAVTLICAMVHCVGNRGGHRSQLCNHR